MRRDAEQLQVPVVHTRAGVEGGLENAHRSTVRHGHIERDRFARPDGSAWCAVAALAKLNRSHGQQTADRILERGAHQPRIGAGIEHTRQRREHLVDAGAAIALARGKTGLRPGTRSVHRFTPDWRDDRHTKVDASVALRKTYDFTTFSFHDVLIVSPQWVTAARRRPDQAPA